jgi:hypothetical protein
MTDERRVGEDDKRRHFRAERFSVSNGKYFFTTREGTLEGPFANREEAERELAVYIRKESGLGIYGSVNAAKAGQPKT